MQNTYVVAIGYSSGGYKPITTFLDHTPHDNAVYVILRHISRRHQSELHSILQKHSKLKIKEASNGEIITKNVIYIPPASSYMTIQKGILFLERRPPRDLNNIINHFFTSLAYERKNKSFGILLSGHGMDGTLGASLIKKQGGIVIVQDPATSEFPSMPENAIRTKMVDYIVRVEEMQDIIQRTIQERLEMIG